MAASSEQTLTSFKIPLSIVLTWPKPNVVTPAKRTWLVPMSICLEVVTGLVVIARVFLRVSHRAGPPGLDDLLIVFGWVFGLCFTVAIIWGMYANSCWKRHSSSFIVSRAVWRLRQACLGYTSSRVRRGIWWFCKLPARTITLPTYICIPGFLAEPDSVPSKHRLYEIIYPVLPPPYYPSQHQPSAKMGYPVCSHIHHRANSRIHHILMPYLLTDERPMDDVEYCEC